VGSGNLIYLDIHVAYVVADGKRELLTPAEQALEHGDLLISPSVVAYARA
jgi:hypothetical protein